MSLPDARTWRRHCRLIERRLRLERDPVAVARLHHQRGWILDTFLREPAAAIRAWLEGLTTWPGHVPCMLGLRDAALATDDPALARQLFDGHLEGVNRPGADPRDLAEMHAWFLAAWVFRWPDPARAAAALRRLDALAPRDDCDLYAELCLDATAQRHRLARLLRDGRVEAARPLADLNVADARAGRLDIRPWLAMAAPTDPYAAARWVEEATALDDPRGQAEGLEALAGHCAPFAPVLRFLAGEIWELVLDDDSRASDAFGAASDVALDRVLIIKEGIRRTRSASGPQALAAVLTLQSERVAEDPLFAASLRTRAAWLRAEADEGEIAWQLALEALQLAPTLDAAARLVLRLGFAAQRWRATADALAPVTAPHWARLRAALLEHAIGDVAGADAALAELTDHLGALRARQRLLTAAHDGAIARAWQREAATLEAGERRAELYLRIGAAYLQQGAADKALTYLLWVLDHDADHVTALRLAEAATAAAGRRGPLIEVVERLLALSDDPADRLPLQRRLATALAEDNPDRAAAILDQVLALHPDDRGSIALLERIYQRLGDARALAALYERVLRRPSLNDTERAAVALRFGRLLEGPLRDDRAALEVYAQAAAALGPTDDRRLPFDEAVDRLSAGAEPSISTLGRDADASQTRPVDDSEYDKLMETGAFSGAFESNLPTVDPLDHLLAADAEPPDADPTRLDPNGPPEDALLSLPRLAPLRPLTRRGTAPVEADGLLSPLTDEVTPISRPDALGQEVAQSAHARFLGAERSRDRDSDPARAIIAAKLKRARKEPPWPAHGDPILIEAIDRYSQAPDPDARFRAATTMGERYAALEDWPATIRALKAARGYRAMDPQVEERLEAALRAQGDWPGLADLLAGRARQSGDRERRQALFLELARLKLAELDDPAGAIDDLRAAIDAGADGQGVWAQLANALKAVRRWEEYVAVLARAGLDRPDAVGPADALTLGQVFLYHLDAPDRAAPFLLRAARALPDRVDVVADLAEARAASGDPPGAARLLEQAIAAAPGPEGREARQVLWLRLARLRLVHAHDAELARRAYREALRDGVRDPAVLEQAERMAVEAQDWVTLAEVLRTRFDAAQTEDDGELRTIGVRLGKLLRDRLNQVDEATEVLLTTYERTPDDVALFRVVETGLSQNARPGQVIRLYRTWVENTPLSDADRFAAGLRLMRAHEAAGDVAAAVAEIERLARIAPADAEVREAMERLYPRAGRWPALVELYQADLQVVPDQDRTALLRKLARALEQGTRDLPAATDAWRAVLARTPDDLEVVRALARLLEAQKRFGELLPVSQREVALTEEPRAKAYVHFRMGSIHETHLGDLEAAAAAYRQALKLDPRCFPALHGLRTLAWEQGDWKGALGLLRREFRLWDAPREQAAVLARMGDVFRDHLDDPAEARRCYQQAVDLWPTCVPAARALADAAFDEQRYADAAPLLQLLSTQKLDSWPRAERAELFYRRGESARILGRRLEAIEALQLALEFQVDHLAALAALVQTAGDLPERADALDARLMAASSARMAAGDPVGHARVESLRGDLALTRLELDAAIAAYRQAAELCPDDLDARRPLVRFFILLRRWTDATAELASFAERLRAQVLDEPAMLARYAEALQWEGDIWCDHAGDPRRAIDSYRRVLQAAPDARDALYRMAQAYVLMKDYERARDVLQSAMPQPGEALDPPVHAEHVFYLGRIHEIGFNDDRRAAELYQRALQIHGGCASALLGLVLLLDRHQRHVTAQKLLVRYESYISGDERGDPVRAALRLHVAQRRLKAGELEAGRALLEPMAAGTGPLARDARFALIDDAVAQRTPRAAIKRLYALLDADVCDVAALRRLVDLVPMDDDEHLLAVLGVLDVLDALTPEQQAHFDELDARARHALARGGRALTDRDLDEHLLHPSIASPLVQLASLCEPALQERFTLGPPPPLSRETLVAGKRHPFFTDMTELQALVGVEQVELHLVDAPEPARIWPGAPPIVVLGAGSQPERRIWAARCFGLLRLRLGRLYALGPARGLEMLGVVGELLAPAEQDEPAGTTLIDALSPRRAERVRAVIAEVGGATLPARYTGEAVLSGATQTADRIGLLTAGRLRPAVEAVARLIDPQRRERAGRGDLLWRIRARSRLQDLVKYALSDAYRQARHAIGIHI